MVIKHFLYTTSHHQYQSKVMQYTDHMQVQQLKIHGQLFPGLYLFKLTKRKKK